MNDLWSGEVVEILSASVRLVGVVCAVVVPGFLAVGILERKLAADLQARVGPNRAGWAGLLQPFADALKLLQKGIAPYSSRREAFWNALQFGAVFASVPLLPWGATAVLMRSELSAFALVWVAVVVAIGTMLSGQRQRTVFSWFGGARSLALAMAAAFPATLCLLAAGVRARGYEWDALVGAQGFSPVRWAAFSNPFLFVAFVVFCWSGQTLFSFGSGHAGDLAYDIGSGVFHRVVGRRLLVMRFARFYGFFAWSLTTTAVFLGGWNLPAVARQVIDELGWGAQGWILEALVFQAKTYALMFLVIWTQKVNPRLRSDQATDFSWAVLSPLALVSFVGAALIAGGHEWLK